MGWSTWVVIFRGTRDTHFTPSNNESTHLRSRAVATPNLDVTADPQQRVHRAANPTKNLRRKRAKKHDQKPQHQQTRNQIQTRSHRTHRTLVQHGSILTTRNKTFAHTQTLARVCVFALKLVSLCRVWAACVSRKSKGNRTNQWSCRRPTTHSLAHELASSRTQLSFTLSRTPSQSLTLHSHALDERDVDTCAYFIVTGRP